MAVPPPPGSLASLRKNQSQIQLVDVLLTFRKVVRKISCNKEHENGVI